MSQKPGVESIYVGGTLLTDLGKGFRRTGKELVKADLLYHMFTKKGERVMMPDFGTNLQDLVFEPNDPITRTQILNEIQAVIDQDPRVELIRSTLTFDENNHTITVDVLLRFIELEVVDTLNISFPSN
jgi:phage baseplate assembly protein W